MALGAKTGGRKKGTPNRMSATVKDNIVAVFDKVGGTKTMVNWAKENLTEFYRLYGRLLPSETTIANPDGSPLLKGITVVFGRSLPDSGVPPKA